MMRFAAFAACLVLPIAAHAGPDVRQILINAAAATNCVLTEEAAELTLTVIGLTRDDVRPVAEAMIAAGEATLEGNTLRIAPGLCQAGAAPPPAFVPSPKMAVVIDVFRAQGCAIPTADTQALLTAAGITDADGAALEKESKLMIEAGLLTIPTEGDATVRMHPPLCLAAAATVPEGANGALVRMLSENGCRLTKDQAQGLIGGYGLTMETTIAAAKDLLSQGLAREEGGELVLIACGW